MQPLAAAEAVKPALPARAARKIEAAGFDVVAARRSMVGVNAGVALGGDTSGSKADGAEPPRGRRAPGLLRDRPQTHERPAGPEAEREDARREGADQVAVRESVKT